MARYVRTQTIRHEIGAAGRFELKVTSADVRIRGTDGGQVQLRATFEFSAESEADADSVFDKVSLVADAGPGRLSVEEAEGTPSLRGIVDRLLRGRGGVDLSIEVEMPRDAELRLETVSGDVSGEGLGGEQRCTTVSGDLFLADAGGNLRVNTVSGDLTVRAARPLGLRGDAVSGDVSVVAPRLNALRLHSVSGDVEVEGELAASGEFRAETVSGDVTVGLVGGATFEVRGISTDISSDLDHRIEGRLDRRRVVIGSGSPAFVFNSMSGDLTIHRPRRIAPQPAESRVTPAADDRPAVDRQLDVLQALERGEIDVDEAARRLGGSRDA
ncbi:MAG TPA: DUF4097 family beta strand repeat-containing protein [Candidatus Limnocylindrales bacterium]|nr:DUF4097 family beta strand repeat-containing protein [Candidatus Limnocylindrales bacterium]